MEKIIKNPGLNGIVNHISSFLDVKSLAQCRLVCHSWRDLIDNDRPWLIFQLEHIQSQEKTFVDTSKDDEPEVNGIIKERFPEWTSFTYNVFRQKNIPILKEVVRQMWIYFEDKEISFNCNPFHEAVGESNIDYVQLLIRCGIDLGMKSPDGWTPMHTACCNGNIDMVQLLIQQTPTFDQTSRTNDGSTIFHLAVYNPNPKVPKLILDALKYEEIRDNNGGTMIHMLLLMDQKKPFSSCLSQDKRLDSI